MKGRLTAVPVVLAFALVTAAFGSGDVGVGAGGGTPGTASNFMLVGTNPLFGRGMNAAIASYDHYIYVGNRTDGSSRCGVGDPRIDTTGIDSCPHPDPGVLVVDVADPATPTVVGEFGTEFVTGANLGQTSRELRVWPQQKLLMIMYFRCSSVIHACPPSADVFSIRFFDLTDPVHPTLVSTYVPSRKPHEMYLWIDPKDSGRALLWISTPTTSVNPDVANILITDISRARDGVFTEIAKGNWNQFFPNASNPANYDNDLALHSMTPSFDGTRTYLAHLRGGFGVLDTSKVANDQIPAGTVESLNDDLLTPVPFPTWGTGPHCEGHTAAGCAESHSAVPLPGRPFAITIDEVYGTFTVPSFGWPWGWIRTWNIAQPRRPRMLAEYKIRQNTTDYIPAPGENEFNSYSSHNPTVTRNLIFDSWHSGGEQAIDVSDPGHPVQTGWFSPTPLAAVANEDPALSRGPNKVLMWSFPIVRNGLIYVVDIRNGLFVLRYTGPRSDEVSGLSFLEGNSNLGDAGALAESGG
ncbi:MAG: LVIVD repeat-containing protein [Actinomycetota bacterium]